MLSVLIRDFSVFKVYKLFIGWNSKMVIESTYMHGAAVENKVPSACLCIYLFVCKNVTEILNVC
jgi:hypothetical protein